MDSTNFKPPTNQSVKDRAWALRTDSYSTGQSTTGPTWKSCLLKEWESRFDKAFEVIWQKTSWQCSRNYYPTHCPSLIYSWATPHQSQHHRHDHNGQMCKIVTLARLRMSSPLQTCKAGRLLFERWKADAAAAADYFREIGGSIWLIIDRTISTTCIYQVVNCRLRLDQAHSKLIFHHISSLETFFSQHNWISTANRAKDKELDVTENARCKVADSARLMEGREPDYPR